MGRHPMAKLTDLRKLVPMDQNSTPQPGEKDVGRDLTTFEKLPEDKKELMKLKDQEEKTAGPEHVEITRKIEDQARQPSP